MADRASRFMNLSAAQLMSVVISRQLKDGDVIITGTKAAIPTAAYRMAQLSGRRAVVAINGANGTVDPKTSEVPPSSADGRYRDGRFNIPLPDVVAAELRGMVDIICVGALQVDGSGRCNLVCIGDVKRPILRGPGTLGLSLIATVPRVIIYLTRHDTRTLVERVDFVSAESLRAGGAGLQIMVTPLGVFGADEKGARLRLLRIHPGIARSTIRSQTGFDLGNVENVPATAGPTAVELEALMKADPFGTLREE